VVRAAKDRLDGDGFDAGHGELNAVVRGVQLTSAPSGKDHPSFRPAEMSSRIAAMLLL